MAEDERQKSEEQAGSIDYQGDAKKIAEAKQKAADADRERLAAEHE